LQVPFEEVIIPLDRPRDPWYLDVNPRGLVPSMSYNGDIITESAIVTNFLADVYPGKLLPKSDTPQGALRRARVAFFVDAYFSKVQNHFFKLGGAKTEEEIAAVGEAAVAAIVKELEPLLRDAKPFFGGSDSITTAEVSIARTGEVGTWSG
jgi:glutathione S-transferase